MDFKLESLEGKLTPEAEKALENLYAIIQKNPEFENKFYNELKKITTSEKAMKWAEFIYSGHIENIYPLDFLFSEASRYIKIP